MKVGGGRPSHLDRGWYLEPTLLTDCTNDMRVAQEEIFGPVVVAIPHDGIDDAIAIANDSPFGLSGTVWTEDDEAALDVARRVRTGTFALNTYTVDPTTPFGGYKQSGIGREMGVEGLEGYVEYKSDRGLRTVAELRRNSCPASSSSASGSAGERARRPPDRGPRRLRPRAGGRSVLPVRRGDAGRRPPRLALRRDGPRLGLHRGRRGRGQAAGAQFGVGHRRRFPCRAARSSAARRRSTASNALRAYPSDFDRWVALGNDEWSWDAVLPYFRRMENDPMGGEYHGSDGPMPIRRFTGDEPAPGDARVRRRLRAGRPRARRRTSARRAPSAPARCRSTRSTACA